MARVVSDELAVDRGGCGQTAVGSDRLRAVRGALPPDPDFVRVVLDEEVFVDEEVYAAAHRR